MAAMLKNRSPSLGTISTSNTMIDSPIPSISITNKPSSGTSLYHTCRSVLDRLSLVDGMSYYLDFENYTVASSATSIMSSDSNSTTNSHSNDPLTKLWEVCRRGTPLATLFNAIQPAEQLKVDFANTQVNECKKTVYHFIVACRNQLSFKEEDVFTLSDLYKDNTNGFVKVVNTIEMILQLLEEKGIICSLNNGRDSHNAPKDTRDKVVLELLETERKYVQDLELLQNYMRELQIQEVLNPDAIHYLFGNLNSLVDFQRRFLIQLEEIGEKSPEEQNFGLLFSQNEEQFAVYEPYCSNYFSAQDLVVQEAPKLQKLAGILNPVYELPSMLIKPVQRICKYPLLVQQLIKSTKNDWRHFEDMELGLECIKRVTEKVNETQRKYENIKIVDELKKRLEEMRITQVDTYGSLLLHERLVIQQADENEKEVIIYFFERTMLICKESKESAKKSTISIKKRRRPSLQPKGLIVMSKIISVKNKSTGEGNWCLAIEWKDKEVDTILLKFRNEEQVKLWESTIKVRMVPMKSTVSNTQLSSMKSFNQLSPNPSLFLTDDDDEEEEDVYSLERQNSISAHLYSASRPKMPRSYQSENSKLPTRSSSNNDYLPHFPVSPPPSNPSSPTTSSRSSNNNNNGSPLVDIATKFMTTGIYTDEIIPIMNRSQSHSASSPFPQQTHLINNSRLRSQSSPNIHQNEPVPSAVPFINSRTLFQQAPPSPLDSPISYRSSRLSDLPSSPTSGPLKIKLNYNEGMYVVMCQMEISFVELMERVDKKIRIIGNLQASDILRLKYQDEDGDLITINSDEDIQMALESRNHLNTINLFVTI